MTISHYSNAIVDLMLGWLRGFANWVLRLFNLAGGAGGSPLLWLSQNWLKLLIFFLLLGIVLDRLVWLIRWRPYWVWFRKERVIVNDEKFFAGGRIDRRHFDEDEELRDEDWQERDFVVTSALAGRRGDATAGGQPRRSTGTRVPERRPRPSNRRRSAVVPKGGEGSRRWDDVVGRYNQEDGGAEDPATADLFGVGEGGNGPDSYEDEVFNVNNLPNAGDGDE